MTIWQCSTCKGDGVVRCSNICQDYDGSKARHVHVCYQCNGKGRIVQSNKNIVRLLNMPYPYKRVI